MSVDSAIEALAMMAERKFGLPVLDGDSIVGVLNIARCLYDAITRMEKASGNSQNAVNEMVKQMATTGNAQQRR